MISYIKESFQELTQNVTWPTREEGQRLMVVVVIFSVLFSLFIAAIDLVFEKIIAQIL